MISHYKRIDQILASSSLPAAARFLKKDLPELDDGEIEQLEDLVLGSESGGARLDRLIETLHWRIGEAYAGLRGKLVTRVVFRPPQYKNVLAGGFADPERVCQEAQRWLRCIQAEARGDPARLFGELVVNLILEFQILDEDAIPALVNSLSVGRRIVRKQWRGAIPIEIVNKSKTDRIEHLLVPQGGALNTMRALTENSNAREYLQKLALECADHPRAAVRAIEGLDVKSGAEKLRIRIKPLIKSACQLAILSMRTSVIGVRTGMVRSHALNLATMQRITRCSPRVLPFSTVKAKEEEKLDPEVEIDQERKQESDQDADQELDQDEVTAWPWMRELRTLIKADSYDKPGLQNLSKQGDFCGKTLAGYALYLIGRRAFEKSTVHKYVFLIANRLMLKFAGRDEVSASEQWETVLADQIAWEDLIEQVLDEDAFYHRRRYSGSAGAAVTVKMRTRPGRGGQDTGTADAEILSSAPDSAAADAIDSSAATPAAPSAHPDRDAAGYSRALLEALRSFIAFLNRGRQASEELKSRLPLAGMISVDATMITVDEFRQALDWFEGPNVNQPNVHLRKTARVALILAFRCGLRRAEIAYLRVCDFDRLLPGESLDKADLRLRVRPWLLRKLKTANALRNLPLRVLIPADELKEVLDWVDGVRAKGFARALVFHTVDASEKSDYAAPMDFDSVVEALEKAFSKGVKGRPPVVPDWHMHQCRHAFSNILLLKLWPELHEVMGQVCRYHPRTLAWIAGPGARGEVSSRASTEQFRLDLFRAGIRGSDLQAIALLMGHGASATTCEHYLHVMDWYVPAEVRQLNISGPQNHKTAASALAALFHHSPAPAADRPPAS